jgi:hypothetical protein
MSRQPHSPHCDCPQCRPQDYTRFVASQNPAYPDHVARETVPNLQAARFEQALRALGYQHIEIVER